MRMMFLVIVICSSAAGFLRAAQKEPHFIVGLCAHFGKNQRPIDLGVKRFQEANIVSLRDECDWRIVEPEPGRYQIPPHVREYLDATSSANIQVLLLLSYGNPHYDKGLFPTSDQAIEAYIRYALFMVQQTRGRVRMFEIWNEWELGLGIATDQHGQRRPGSAEDYVKLVSRVYPALKQAFPDLILLAGASSGGGTRNGWLERTMQLGLLNHCDGVSFHPYVREFGAKGTPEYCISWVRDIQAMLRKYSQGKPVPMYITELGWPTAISSVGILPDQQARFLARTYLLARTVPELHGLWWFNLRRGWELDDEHSTFGILLNDHTPGPTHAALRDVAPLVCGATRATMLDTRRPDLLAIRYDLPNGQAAIAAWSTQSDGLHQITLLSTAKNPSALSLLVVGSGESVALPWTPPGALQFTVTDTPVIIRGDLTNVSLEMIKTFPMPYSKRPQNSRAIIPAQIAMVVPFEKWDVNPSGCGTYIMDAAAWDSLMPNLPRTGPEDCRATLGLTYQQSDLLIRLEVTDDRHVQDQPPTLLWKGDSVQVGVSSLRHGTAIDTSSLTELTIALVDGQPLVYQAFAAFDAGSRVTCDFPTTIVRQGNQTIYQIRLPADRTGIQLQSGHPFAISLIVNDNDGAGRKGFLAWGSGIGHSKDPTRYNWAIPVP